MDSTRRGVLEFLSVLPVSGMLFSQQGRAEESLPSLTEEADIDEEFYFKGFSDEFLDSERNTHEIIADISDVIIEVVEIESLEVREEEYNSPSQEAHRQVSRAKQLARLLDENLEYNIPVSQIDEIENYSRPVAKYMPFVSSAFNFYEACEQVHELPKDASDEVIEEADEQFLIAALVLVSEIALLQTSVMYKTAFVGTRYVANYGLIRLRSRVGLRGYALLLSEVHWAIRGQLELVKTYIIETTYETVVEFGKMGLNSLLDILFRDDFDLSDWIDDQLDSQDQDVFSEGLITQSDLGFDFLEKQ